jgi:hypothetical protein
MKKVLSVKEVVYTSVNKVVIDPVTTNVEEVQKLTEHIENFANEQKLYVLVNEAKLTEDCNEMKVNVNKEEFKSLFGPGKKPKKGDVLSIAGLSKKFNVKKSKKFKAGKKGKGYKLTLNAS